LFTEEDIEEEIERQLAALGPLTEDELQDDDEDGKEEEGKHLEVVEEGVGKESDSSQHDCTLQSPLMHGRPSSLPPKREMNTLIEFKMTCTTSFNPQALSRLPFIILKCIRTTKMMVMMEEEV